MAEVKRKHIPGLDGIRAIAFIMVYLSHMELGHSYVGGIGVAVFFFLSGYLITTLMRMESDETGSISITAFYIRRVFRIFPTLYIVVLFAVFLYFVKLNPTLNLSALLSVIFYYSNYFMIHHNGHGGMAGLAGTWSLSVEEHFYLVFPVIFLAICKLSRSTQAKILGVICVVCFLWRCVLAFGLHAEGYRTYLATDTRFDSILIGAILALTLNPLFDKIPSWFKANPRLWAIFGLLTVLIVDHIPLVNRSLSFTVLGLGLFPVFWYVILYSEHRGIQWLESPVMRTIGRWSYSLYLVHQLMISTVEQLTHTRGALAAILAIPGCLAFAWGVEKFIEKPSYRLRNRILKKMSLVPPPKLPASRVVTEPSASTKAEIFT